MPAPCCRPESARFGPTDTAAEVEHDLSTLGAGLLLAAVDQLARGEAVEAPQDEALVTLCPTADQGIRHGGLVQTRGLACELRPGLAPLADGQDDAGGLNAHPAAGRTTSRWRARRPRGPRHRSIEAHGDGPHCGLRPRYALADSRSATRGQARDDGQGVPCRPATRRGHAVRRFGGPRMIAPARTAALDALRAVHQDRVALPDALARVRQRLTDQRDVALASEILIGTLRWRESLDYLIEVRSSRASRPTRRARPRHPPHQRLPVAPPGPRPGIGRRQRRRGAHQDARHRVCLRVRECRAPAPRRPSDPPVDPRSSAWR